MEFLNSFEVYEKGYCLYEYQISDDREMWRHWDKLYSVAPGSVYVHDGKFTGSERVLPFAKIEDVRNKHGQD